MDNIELKKHLTKMHDAGFYNNVIDFFGTHNVKYNDLSEEIKSYIEINHCEEKPDDLIGALKIYKDQEDIEDKIVFKINQGGKKFQILLSKKGFSKFLIKNFTYNQKLLELNTNINDFNIIDHISIKDEIIIVTDE